MTELVKVYSSKLTVFELKHKYERARISVDGRLGNYNLTINSSFGNYTCSWFDLGVSLYTFLESMDLEYLASKMGAADEELDVEKTVEAVKTEIRLLLTDGSISKEQAQEELEQLNYISDEHEFVSWLHVTDIQDAWEYRITRPGQKFLEFQGFYNTFWPEFLKALKEHDSSYLKLESREDIGGVEVTSYTLGPEVYALGPEAHYKVAPPPAPVLERVRDKIGSLLQGWGSRGKSGDA